MLKSKNFVEVSVGENYALGRTSDGHVFGWGKKELINADGSDTQRNEPVPIELDKKIVAISAGPRHAAFVDDQGLVYTWGVGGDFFRGGGQLGHNSKSTEKRPK